MEKSLILSIDCGTQSVRALLFDRNGNLLAKEKVDFEPYISPHPGWAEQDAEIYWNSACGACLKLKENNPEIWEKIMGVVVTTQRDSCINVDKEGKPLRPAILWLDQRMAKCEKPLRINHRAMYFLAGMQKTVGVVRKKSKANWIQENQPDIWDKTYKYIMVSGFFIHRLTGKFVDSVASQIGHIPFDYKHMRWPKSPRHSKWDIFGVRRDKLPGLVAPGSVIGGVTQYAARASGIPEGLPVIAGASDKGCETLGMGCLSSDSASLSFGTTATIQTTTKDYMEPIRFMPSYVAAVPGRFNPEVEIFRGYWMVSWFKKEFGEKEAAEARKAGILPEKLLDEKLISIPPGCEGLMLQPYWTAGLRSPEAKGAIIGFSDVHTKAHIYRAIIEGINFALMEGLDKIERCTGKKVERLMASGGGSQSDAVCQITSDMFNLPVNRGLTHEMSGLGAAIIGYIGMGVYGSVEEAAEKMVHHGQVFKPDPENSLRYRALYKQVYKGIYPGLKQLYRKLGSISLE